MRTGWRLRKRLKTWASPTTGAATALCLVEWADRVRGLLPEDCWMITLEPTGAPSRSVRLELPASARGIIDRLAERLA